MNIIIPASTNCPELRYSLEVLFNVFLGIDYKLTISDVANITVCGSHKNLIIPSVFFSTLVYSGDSAYSVPTDVSKDTIIISEQVIDIVSIYGTSNISMSESEITLHSDILASTFFMLR